MGTFQAACAACAASVAVLCLMLLGCIANGYSMSRAGQFLACAWCAVFAAEAACRKRS